MLEQALIIHGAPTLARMKLGSLFNVACADREQLNEDVERLNLLLQAKGVVLTVLKEWNGKALLYLYRENELLHALNTPEIRELLADYGYSAWTIADALEHLRSRLLSDCCFPHEIGVFLGYPLSDVKEFIRNEGRNCLCCGYWKVYSNPCDAQKLFARYRKCTETYIRLFAEGCPLSKLTVQAKPA